MIAVLVAATTAALIAGLRWGLTRYLTARRIYPRRSESDTALVAQAERDLEGEGDLGAYLGHLWAWRDLLADTAKRNSPEWSEAGADSRDALTNAAERIRASLDELDGRRSEE